MLLRHGAVWVERVRAVRPSRILGIGFLAFVLYAFPGFMSSDSVVQLGEARSGEFSNPHPPFMSAVWRLLDGIVSGPLLMLLLQGGLFFGGLYVILCRRVSSRVAAVLTLAIVFFPPVLTTMAVIWKDSQMAAFLIAGTAALLSPSRWRRVGGVLLITAACATRHNAFAATVPLIGLLFEWRPGLRWWKRYALAGAAAIASFALAIGVNRALTVHTVFMSPAYIDIVGVIAHTHDRTDDDLRHVLRGTPLRVHDNIQATARALYSPRNAYWINHGDDRMFDDARTLAEQQAATRAWKELVTSDWGAYFAHRWAGFRELLALSDEPLWSPVYIAITQYADQPAFIDHDGVTSWLQRRAGEAFGWLATDTVVFDPYIYAVLALLLLVGMLWVRDRTAVALLASGLLYELGYFFVAGTPDSRYSHWLFTCTCVAAVLAAIHLRQRREVGT